MFKMGSSFPLAKHVVIQKIQIFYLFHIALYEEFRRKSQNDIIFGELMPLGSQESLASRLDSDNYSGSFNPCSDLDLLRYSGDCC